MSVWRNNKVLAWIRYPQPYLFLIDDGGCVPPVAYLVFFQVELRKNKSWKCYWLVSELCTTLCNPWTAACQVSLSITNSRNLLKLMSIESMMPSNHLILCSPVSWQYVYILWHLLCLYHLLDYPHLAKKCSFFLCCWNLCSL